MSTLQVDRIIPYQSSSVLVEGLSAPNLATTGSNTFVGNQNIQGTITASIAQGFALVGGVGNVSTLVATSSFGSSGNFATTGSNTFNGDQLINGKSTQTFNAPVNNTQNDIAVVNSASIDGQTYTNVFFGMQDYSDFGDQYKDAFVFDYWTDFNFATGSEFIVSPKRIGGSMLLSGSAGGVSRTGISQLRDLGGKTFLNQYANLMNIGALESVTTDQILIGNKALTFLRVSSLKNEITGSTFISGSGGLQVTGSVGISQVMTLAGQDPLPAGAVGQLAVSASNLYYNNGATWTQIN